MSDITIDHVDAELPLDPKLANLAKMKFEITELPSKCLPYSFDLIKARKFKPSDLSKIFNASRNEDFKAMVDVIGSTIDQDIYELTVPDFYYIMYWHRLNSYTKSPFEFPWRSKYGFDETYTLTSDNIKINYIKMTLPEYEDNVALGLRIPTVEDLLEMQKLGLNSSDSWITQRAQFLQGADLEEKIAMLDDLGIEFLELMREFGIAVEHGVEETVEVTTSRTYSEVIANLKELVDQGETSYKPVLDKLNNAKNKVLEAETLTLTMNVFQLFPNL